MPIIHMLFPAYENGRRALKTTSRRQARIWTFGLVTAAGVRCAHSRHNIIITYFEDPFVYIKKNIVVRSNPTYNMTCDVYILTLQ